MVCSGSCSASSSLGKSVAVFGGICYTATYATPATLPFAVICMNLLPFLAFLPDKQGRTRRYLLMGSPFVEKKCSRFWGHLLHCYTCYSCYTSLSMIFIPPVPAKKERIPDAN
jgi:hypothetical protein